MKKGSITIFSLLSMILVTAMLFTLLEGARFQELRRLSQLQTELALESVFANYNTYLWEEYHLLATNQSEMEENLILAGNGRQNGGRGKMNLLQFQVKEVSWESYILLTDGQGGAYIKAVSSYMKQNIIYETMKSIYEKYEEMKKLSENETADHSIIKEALETLEEIQKIDETKERVSLRSGNNPLVEIQNMMDKGVLNLVLKNTEVVSESEIELQNAVSHRFLQQGKNYQNEEVNWMDRVLLQQYFLNYMSNFCQQRDNRCLSYEVEYLIGGKASDKENLEVVVSQLLALREVSNFLYLMSDKVKVEEVTLLATVLAGVSANPIIIDLVKTGLLTAWAFAESVLDVRAILNGKNVSFIKNTESWTLDLKDIGVISKEYAMAKGSTGEGSYEDYLGILLLFQNENTLALRGMDVQEAAVRQATNNAAFYMDRMVVCAQTQVVYKYEPVFLSLGMEYWKNNWEYELFTDKSFGYY